MNHHDLRGPADLPNQWDAEDDAADREQARLQRQEDQVFELEMGWTNETNC